MNVVVLLLHESFKSGSPVIIIKSSIVYNLNMYILLI